MTSPEILKLAEEFIAETELDMGMDESYGDCEMRSREFHSWLNQRMVPNFKVILLGLKEELVGCHEEWEGIKPRNLYHMVIRIDDFIVDLSGAQFGPKHDRVLWTLEEILELWSKVIQVDEHFTEEILLSNPNLGSFCC